MLEIIYDESHLLISDFFGVCLSVTSYGCLLCDVIADQQVLGAIRWISGGDHEIRKSFGPS